MSLEEKLFKLLEDYGCRDGIQVENITEAYYTSDKDLRVYTKNGNCFEVKRVSTNDKLEYTFDARIFDGFNTITIEEAIDLINETII